MLAQLILLWLIQGRFNCANTHNIHIDHLTVIVSVGTINSALVNPREIFKSSILSNACAIIAIHNHPSGNIMPSREDVNITKRLKMSGAILGIDLLDHIIIGGTSGDMYSFKSKRKDLFAEQYHEHER